MAREWLLIMNDYWMMIHFWKIDEFYNDRYCDIKWLQKKRFKKIIKINKDK